MTTGTFTEEQINQVGITLNDPNKPLHERFRALFTLKNVGGDLAVQHIGNCFFDTSALLKHELAYVLGQMQNQTAVPILNSVLENVSENAMVRHEAAEALGAIGLEESLLILEKFVKDEVKEVSETCQIARDRIKFNQEKKDKLEEGADSNPFYSVDPAPPSKRAPTKELLEQMMNTELSLFERYRAMFALRNRADEESVLALTEGLKDTSALFRHEIAYVLGQLAHVASVPALIESLKNPAEHEMVRHECAEALGSVASPEVLPILKEFQHDQQRVVKESCEVALDMFEYENSTQFQYADALSKAPSS